MGATLKSKFAKCFVQRELAHHLYNPICIQHLENRIALIKLKMTDKEKFNHQPQKPYRSRNLKQSNGLAIQMKLENLDIFLGFSSSSLCLCKNNIRINH
jgi:hypothetical protein